MSTHDSSTLQIDWYAARSHKVHRTSSPIVGYKGREYWVQISVAPGGNGTRYLCRNGSLRGSCVCHDTDGWYPTEAEATFRIALYTDPAKALAAFLGATGGAYEGTCGMCVGTGSLVGDPECDFCAGRGRVAVYSPDASDAVADCPRCDRTPCPTCHGTGGPPARALLEVAADWYYDHEMELEASVLRSINT